VLGVIQHPKLSAAGMPRLRTPRSLGQPSNRGGSKVWASPRRSRCESRTTKRPRFLLMASRLTAQSCSEISTRPSQVEIA